MLDAKILEIYNRMSPTSIMIISGTMNMNNPADESRRTIHVRKAVYLDPIPKFDFGG